MLCLNRHIHQLALALLLCAALTGCSYGLASDIPTVLGEGTPTLKVTAVEQPTMYTWVVYTVRSTLRNEFAARNIATWVDSGASQYTMHVKVNSFTLRSAVSSSSDETLIFTGAVSLTATIYNSADNSEVWKQTVTYSNEFDSDVEEDAARRLFTQAVRRLADNMRNTF